MLCPVVALFILGLIFPDASAGFAFSTATLRKVRGSLFKKQPEPPKPRLHSRQIRAKQLIAASRRRVTYARVARFALYWGSSIDSIQAVIANDYKKGWMSRVAAVSGPNAPGSGVQRYLPQVYSTIFYFARLRPRLLYSVGAFFRALQVGHG
jgi:hypothetical protein